MVQICTNRRGPNQRLRWCQTARQLLEPTFFRALCDPTRVGVLVRLAELGAPAPVKAVASCCEVDLSVVSRHLGVLRAAGIVASQRQGKEVLYQIRWQVVVETLRQMADAIAACCPPPLDSKKETPRV